MDFVVFSDDWGRHPSSCQHLFTHIVRKHRVLWVNTIGMRTPRLNLYDLGRIAEKLKEWTNPNRPQANDNSSGTCDEQGGVHTCSPVSTPFNSNRLFRMVNRAMIVRAVRRKMRDLGFERPVLVASVPNVADVIGHLHECKVVYYCYDDFTLWPGVAKGPMEIMERVLLDEADVILAVSAELQRNKRGKRAKTHLFPHGVDIDHFRSCADPVLETASPMQALKKPVIGFFGLLDERSDYDLLRRMAIERPQWSIALIGPSQVNLSELESLANVHLLGEVDYVMLPQYAKAFDICIMPYVLNELTENINPLKMKEYLAMGKPVISTPVAEARRLSGALRIASAEHFIQAIEDGLERGVTPEEAAAREEALRGQSWEERAQEFMRLVTDESVRE